MVGIKIFGVEITVDFTVPAVAAWMLLHYPPVTCAVIVLACVMHEAAHLLALTFFRKRPTRLQLSGVGMRLTIPGAALYAKPMLLVVLLSGIFVNLLAAAVFSVMGCAEAALVNLALGVCNLFPFRATDGGTLLFALLEDWLLVRNPQLLKALRFLIPSVLLLALFVCLMLSGTKNPSAWGMLIVLVLSECSEQ